MTTTRTSMTTTTPSTVHFAHPFLQSTPPIFHESRHICHFSTLPLRRWSVRPSIRPCSRTIQWLVGETGGREPPTASVVQPPAAETNASTTERARRPPAERTRDKSFLQCILVSRNVIGVFFQHAGVRMRDRLRLEAPGRVGSSQEQIKRRHAGDKQFTALRLPPYCLAASPG